MPVKDTGTEQLIKDTAKRVLFGEGKLHATTQEIADAAGVNRASLHYYFRSRDQLVEQVFQEAMKGLSDRLDQVMLSSLVLRPKVERLIDVFFEEMIVYPYEETFLITEINTMGHQLVGAIHSKPVAAFLREVEKEMAAGRVKKMNPIHFLMNLFSLLSYPLIMAPLYRQLFGISKGGFDKIIAERKEVICQLLFI